MGYMTTKNLSKTPTKPLQKPPKHTPKYPPNPSQNVPELVPKLLVFPFFWSGGDIKKTALVRSYLKGYGVQPSGHLSKKQLSPTTLGKKLYFFVGSRC